MGRDKKEAISTATYQDIVNVLRETEARFDCLVDVMVTTSKSPNSLYVEARTTAWTSPTEHQDYSEGRYVNSVSLPIASVIYQVVTRLYHRIDHDTARQLMKSSPDH